MSKVSYSIITPECQNIEAHVQHLSSKNGPLKIQWVLLNLSHVTAFIA